MSQLDRDEDMRTLRDVHNYPGKSVKNRDDLMFAILRSLHRIEKELEEIRWNAHQG